MTPRSLVTTAVLLAVLLIPLRALGDARGPAITAPPLNDSTQVKPVYGQTDRAHYPPPTPVYAPLRVYSHPARALSLEFSPDGKVLAAGDHDGVVWLWPLGLEELVTKFKANRRGVTALAFSPDGSTLASGGGDGMVRVWDLNKHVVQGWLDARHRGAVTALAFNRLGTLLFSGSADDAIWMRDVITGRKLLQYFGHSADVVGIAVPPHGRCVISGAEDRSLQAWSTETGEQVDFSSQNSKVSALTLSRDGKQLAAATGDGLIALRRTDGCTVHTVAMRFELHAGPVRTLEFSPDQRWLYSGGDDGRIIKWDIERGIPVQEFFGTHQPILALAISPDGSLLATATKDRIVRIWKQGETTIFAQNAPAKQTAAGLRTRVHHNSAPSKQDLLQSQPPASLDIPGALSGAPIPPPGPKGPPAP